MKISKTLHLVIPIETEAGELFAHSTPIMPETFKFYARVMATAFKEIYVDGPGLLGGPRIAAFILEEVAKRMGMWDGDTGVQVGLIGEINRRTNIMVPSPKGWMMVPLEDAVRDGTIDSQDASEVENAICFFTLASSMHRRSELLPIMEQVSRIWGGRMESLTCSEFMNSLPTSKGIVSSTAKSAEGLSVPS
jgi:hypothetical protein